MECFHKSVPTHTIVFCSHLKLSLVGVFPYFKNPIDFFLRLDTKRKTREIEAILSLDTFLRANEIFSQI